MKQEAMQVNTPPASAGTASSFSGGFFLDLSPSVDGQEPGFASAHRTLVSSAASRTAMKAQITSQGRQEWWDDIEDTSLISDVPVIRVQIESPKFEWNTPEHLPNSPLCPLFQKERHGGTGGDSVICVYHGRK
jgi:hypothetical protein